MANGKDVAGSLAYNEPHKAVVRHVEEEDRMKRPILSSGGMQDTWLINESGVYNLIFNSQLPSAKKFKRWVTSEVLPAIRKTGTYTKPLSAIEMMELQFQAIKEVDGKVALVDQDLQEFKRDMPILGIEESLITGAVRKKGVQCLGGKESNAYKDRSVRSKIYSDIYGQIKREFGIESYKAIKRNQCDKAINVIENYMLPLVLDIAVSETNAQTKFA